MFFPKANLRLQLLHQVKHFLLIPRVRHHLNPHRQARWPLHSPIGILPDLIFKAVVHILLILTHHCDRNWASSIIEAIPNMCIVYTIAEVLKIGEEVLVLFLFWRRVGTIRGIWLSLSIFIASRCRSFFCSRRFMTAWRNSLLRWRVWTFLWFWTS